MSKSQNIHWCFTINKGESILLGPKLMDEFEDIVRYAAWELEEGTTTGNLHIQGYVELKEKTSLRGICSLFPNWNAHFEPRMGTREQARDYCMGIENGEPKVGVLQGPWEFGEFKAGGQGARNDLRSVANSIIAGTNIMEIALEHPVEFIKFNKGIERLHSLIQPRRNWKTEIIVLWGKSGTGKSKLAWDCDPNAYEKAAEHTWWDGYNGEDTIIIDDYAGELPFRYLLRLADRYPMQVQIKGGTTQFRSRRIIFTTNIHPKYWYKNEDYATFERRITMLCEVQVDENNLIKVNSEKNKYLSEVAGNTKIPRNFINFCNLLPPLIPLDLITDIEDESEALNKYRIMLNNLASEIIPHLSEFPSSEEFPEPEELIKLQIAQDEKLAQEQIYRQEEYEKNQVKNNINQQKSMLGKINDDEEFEAKCREKKRKEKEERNKRRAIRLQGKINN